ncbi:MAG: nuclear transport factor 2 family protein [Terriglobales bacterium]
MAGRRWFGLVLLVVLTTGLVTAQQAKPAPAAAELTQLLREFLAGAGSNDAAVHERFWADDLIYTGSSGRRVGKADILKDVKGAPPPKPDDPKVTFEAEDIRIQQYGETAIVAFRLAQRTEKDGKVEVNRFLNTGTFVRRNGKWQAVAWQATKLQPPPAETVK